MAKHAQMTLVDNGCGSLVTGACDYLDFAILGDINDCDRRVLELIRVSWIEHL